MNWGPWCFEEETLTLKLFLTPFWDQSNPPRWIYEVDLERIQSSAAVLDWLCQVSQKGWATAEVVGYLLKALDDIFYFQANLCSCGVEKKSFDPKLLLDKFMIETQK